MSLLSKIHWTLSTAIIISFSLTFAAARAADDADAPLTEAGMFDDRQLLDVQIEIPEADWNKLSAQSLDFVTAFGKGSFENNYTYFSGNISINGRVLPGVELRKKGFFGSSDQLRPSLKVKIANGKQARLLGGLERLTLNNNKQDRANVSQLLAYKLFNDAGLRAPRCCLAKVTVNGQSLGIYTHVESIDEKFLQRVFEDDSGNLYEGVFPTDFLTDRIERFEIKQAKKKNDREDLIRIAQLLENPPADLVEQLRKTLDVDEFITYWALESLIGFWDGYAANQNNYYLYKDPRDSKLHFIPWGADMTLMPAFFPTGGAKSVYAKGQLAYQLNQDPQIREMYHAAMLKLLETVWKEDDLLREVDRVEALVKEHLHSAQGDISQAAQTTRTFIKNRRKEILNETKDGPVHVTTPPAKPFYMREVGLASATFSTEWGADDESGAQATLKLELNGEVIEMQQVVATAGPARFPNFGGPRNQGPPPPTVVLTGVRASDQKKMTLTVMFTAEQFGESDEPVTVQGMMLEGEAFMFGTGMRSFAGKAELKSAGQQDGALVEGSVTGRLYEMKGFGR